MNSEKKKKSKMHIVGRTSRGRAVYAKSPSEGKVLIYDPRWGSDPEPYVWRNASEV